MPTATAGGHPHVEIACRQGAASNPPHPQRVVERLAEIGACASRSGAVVGPAYRGEHNHEVLTQWLGASAEEITQLEQGGVIHAEERP